MKTYSDDFSRLSDGRLLDLDPMRSGKPALVSADGGKTWEVFEGLLGQISDAKPLSKEEAAIIEKKPNHS